MKVCNNRMVRRAEKGIFVLEQHKKEMKTQKEE